MEIRLTLNTKTFIARVSVFDQYGLFVKESAPFDIRTQAVQACNYFLTLGQHYISKVQENSTIIKLVKSRPRGGTR